MSTLATSPLAPCKRGTPPLDQAGCAELLRELPAWSVEQVQGVAQLHGSFAFSNFVEAMHFANTVGALAEAANHHPLLQIEWGKVDVHWWTHTINGLHSNDFVMAARTDAAFREAT